ncbi:MAG: DUF4870 domain-containing protein [Chitinophagaceae bacterium]|nr:DUF4870 domain-containing protein [Chitinophagaceae bacterium]
METQELMGQESLPAITPTSDEKTMAILSHILVIIAWILAPLIIYLLKKDESVFVREHAKESLNFQITVLIGYIISGILVIVLIGVVLIWLLAIINLIFVIIATIKASEGKMYKYPFCLRLIK